MTVDWCCVESQSSSIPLPTRVAGPALQHQPALEESEEVSANEDLMREHGLSKRLILAYDKVVRRVQSDQDLKMGFSP